MAVQSPFFLARQPIVEEDGKTIVMYEVFLRSKKSPDKFPREIPPYKAAFIVIDLLASIGYNKVAGNKKIMLNLSIQNVVNKSYLETLVPEKTVLNLQKPYTEITKKQWEYINSALQNLKKEGFEFAFDVDLIFDKDIRLLAIKYADYIVAQIKDLDKTKDPFLIKKQCIATRIEDQKMFLLAKRNHCDLFEGYFFGKPEPIYAEISIAALTTTIIKTLSAIERHADLKEIEELIKSDPGLVTKLLKFVNSSYFYLPLEIKSIRQALAYLGINNLKKYLLVLMVLELAEALRVPIETYKKMLLAAVLSEKLADVIKVNRDVAFLGGLFFSSDIVFNIEPVKIAVDLKLHHEILEGYLEDNPNLHCLFYLSKVLAFDLEKDEKFKKCLNNLGLDEESLNPYLKEAEEIVEKLLI
ncbi:MAG TPA: HDOD domain-containing protein [Aquifex aeolicus]|uniref:HDOD domain-containing protein n=1 Tax=Aquifex aeolicus TaxID=63363 RepID=A0A9D0YN39_AQUAO|nr:HDOD domain-containing protein [Aquifex aeolicus]